MNESRRASMDEIGVGGEYSDVDARVLACYAEQGHRFTKKDGTQTPPTKGAGVVIKYQTEAGKLLEDYFDLGSDFLPAESADDADAGVSSAQGDFIVRIEGSTRKFSPNFGWGIYLAALKKINFPVAHLDEHGLGSLVDHVFHLVNQRGGERKTPTAKGATHFFNRVPNAWHSSFIIEAAGGSKKAGNGAEGGKPGLGVKQSGNGVEARLKPVILSVLEDAGKPVSKAKLVQLFNDAVRADDAWSEEDQSAASTLLYKGDFWKGFEGVVNDGVKIALAGQ